jgi:hypothetical protein
VTELSSQALVPKHCFEIVPFTVQITAEAADPRIFALLHRDSAPNRVAGTAAALQNCCLKRQRMLHATSRLLSTLLELATKKSSLADRKSQLRAF